MTLSTTARNAMADAYAALLDGGSIDILNTSAQVMATLALPNPAYGAAANGVVTMNTVASQAVVTAGDVDEVQFKNSGGNVMLTLTAGIASDAAADREVVFDQRNFTVGEGIRISSHTLEQPAG